MTWTRKSNYFTIAASILFVISLLALGRTMVDKSNYVAQGKVRDDIRAIADKAQKAQSLLDQQIQRGPGYDTAINKEMELFKYRDVIPMLNEILVKCLPDANNNPGQADLYKAFAEGNVEKVMEIPRVERKQLFVTKASVRYSENIGTENFEEGKTSVSAPAAQSFAAPGMMGMPGMGGPGMGMPGMGGPGMGRPVYTPPSSNRQPTGETAEGGAASGFVVTIEGYSPYRNINDLLDPPGIANDKTKWGMVTRLANLDAVCPNSPFKLYHKTSLSDFSVTFAEVDLSKPMPVGIGVEKQENTPGAAAGYSGKQKIFVDPMTEEVISKEQELDSHGNPKLDSFNKPIYKVNDHWFRINAKFVWSKDTKKEEVPPKANFNR
jgi:hypothetical protein